MSEENKQLDEVELSSSFKHVLRDYAEWIILAVLVAILLRIFVVSAYRVNSNHMVPSLQLGDFVFATKWSLGWPWPMGGDLDWKPNWPQRGKIVVFGCPKSRNIHCVKRLVALPGDRVEIKGGVLWINQKPVDYVQGPDSPDFGDEKIVEKALDVLQSKSHPLQNSQGNSSTSSKNFGPIVVPPDQFFVLNDLREAGEDSRQWGGLPRKSLRGIVSCIWLSFDWLRPWAGGKMPSIRWGRLLRRVD